MARKKPEAGAEAPHPKAQAEETAEAPRVGKAAGNRGKGRKKGVPNKNTTALKDAIMQAFDKAGGVDYLVWLSKAEPRAFAALVGKVLPLTIKGDPDQPMRVEIAWAA
jgi:hypothetical protein